MSSSRDHSKYPIRTALLGFCIPAMEALYAHNHPFVAVVPEEFTSTVYPLRWFLTWITSII